MKKQILEKHKNHEIEIIEGPFDYGYNGKSNISSLMKQLNPNDKIVSHHGKIMCKKCKVQLKWASKIEMETYKEVYQPNMTYTQYTKRFNDYVHSSSVSDPANIYLAVPFRDKDKAKQFGATWDPYHKLWYTTVRRQHADKLIPWMMPDDVEKLKKERTKYHND